MSQVLESRDGSMRDGKSDRPVQLSPVTIKNGAMRGQAIKAGILKNRSPTGVETRNVALSEYVGI